MSRTQGWLFTNLGPHGIVGRVSRPCPFRNRGSMKVAVIKERRAHERRVAASPDTVKRMVGMGLEVVTEGGAGSSASFTDAALAAAGASIVADPAAALGDADILLKVQRPLIDAEAGIDELTYLKRGSVLIGLLQPTQNPDDVDAYARAGIAAFAMELVPRITRAQAMDVLSSQANLAGYKAVVEAAAEFGRAFPMMMTAAGTIKAARVLVMGAGVAGLQAIATARRLGAIVYHRRRGGGPFGGNPRRLCSRDGGRLSAPSARQDHRGPEADGHRYLHRADPRAQGAYSADGCDAWRAGPGICNR